jgi:hypothetical protein
MSKMNILPSKSQYFNFLLLLFCVVKVEAQVNLIPNGSFEDTTILSTLAFNNAALQNCTNNWHSLDSTRIQNCTSGFLHEGMQNSYFRPSGAYFIYLYQLPRHGFGYAAITHSWDYPWQPPPSSLRSVASCRLKQQLVQGTKYCARAYLSPFEREDYFADGFGMYFDNGMLDTIVVKDSSGIYPFVQAQVMCDSIIADTLNWKKVAGTFIAKGDETHIHMANWHSESATQRYQQPFTNVICLCGEWAVDDVSLIPVDIANWLPDVVASLGDSVYIGLPPYEVPDAQWYTYNGVYIGEASGIKVLANQPITYYIQAIDVCDRIAYDTMAVYAYPAGLQSSSYNAQQLLVYPNPATSVLHIQSTASSFATVYNSQGQLMSTVNLQQGKATIACQTWPSGTYLVRCGKEVQRIVVRW